MIIYGSRTRNKVMGQVVTACAKCQQSTPHAVTRSRRWMTLFFIPIFPITKSSFSRCNTCGVQVRVDNRQADSWFTSQPQQPQIPAAPRPN